MQFGEEKCIQTMLKNPKLRKRIVSVEEMGMDSISWERNQLCALLSTVRKLVAQ
jgi:hypothetical protein